MPNRRIRLWLAALCLVLTWPAGGSRAGEPAMRVVVSFSILEDIARQIGGDAVAVTSLVGRDSDAHALLLHVKSPPASTPQRGRQSPSREHD